MVDPIFMKLRIRIQKYNLIFWCKKHCIELRTQNDIPNVLITKNRNNNKTITCKIYV